MGTDIHLYVQEKQEDGTWKKLLPSQTKYKKNISRKDGSFYIQRNYELFNALAGIRGEGPKLSASKKGVPKNICPKLKKNIEYDVEGHSHHYMILSSIKLDLEKEEVFDLSSYEYKMYQKFPGPPYCSYKFSNFYSDNKEVSEKDMQKIIAMKNFESNGSFFCKVKYKFSSEDIYGKDFISLVSELKKRKKDPKDIMLVFYFDC